MFHDYHNRFSISHSLAVVSEQKEALDLSLTGRCLATQCLMKTLLDFLDFPRGN